MQLGTSSRDVSLRHQASDKVTELFFLLTPENPEPMQVQNYHAHFAAKIRLSLVLVIETSRFVPAKKRSRTLSMTL